MSWIHTAAGNMAGPSYVERGMGHPYNFTTTPLDMQFPGSSYVLNDMEYPYNFTTTPPTMQFPGLSNFQNGMKFPYNMQVPGWSYQQNNMNIPPNNMQMAGMNWQYPIYGWENQYNVNIGPNPTVVVGLGDWRVKPGYEELYQAIMTDDWEKANRLFTSNPVLKTEKISQGDDTVLHIAAEAGLSSFVKNLVGLLQPDDLAITNKDGNTAFCLVAASGNVELAKLMWEKNNNLHMIPGKNGILPIDMAVGQSDMVNYLFDLQKDESDSNARIKSFHNLITTGLYDEALALLKQQPDLATARVKSNEENAPKTVAPVVEPNEENAPNTVTAREESKEKAVCILVRKLDEALALIKEHPDLATCRVESNQENAPNATSSGVESYEGKATKTVAPGVQSNEENAPNTVTTPVESKETAICILVRKLIMSSNFENQDQQGFLKGIFRQFSGGDKIYRNMLPPKALELVKEVWENVKNSKFSSKIIEELVPLLFQAAAKGHIELLIIIIPEYPWLIMRVDPNGRNIFDVAILCRQKDIFKLLNTGTLLSYKDKILQHKDNNGNNILHLAGMLPPLDRLNTVPDAALQLQQEILWFKEVKNLVYQSTVEARNNQGKTARDIFNEQHKDLKEKRERWVKDTANSCMIVATLIATVVFAAAFTIPGGNKEQTGTPYVIDKPTFIIFVISDAISLVSSICSIVTFLSILTSQYEDDEFLSELPKKLILGLATLLSSIAAMMAVFGATIFIVFKDGALWVPILVSTIAFVPVIFFLRQHLRLFCTILVLTGRSDSLLRIVENRRSLQTRKLP